MGSRKTITVQVTEEGILPIPGVPVRRGTGSEITHLTPAEPYAKPYCGTYLRNMVSSYLLVGKHRICAECAEKAAEDRATQDPKRGAEIEVEVTEGLKEGELWEAAISALLPEEKEQLQDALYKEPSYDEVWQTIRKMTLSQRLQLIEDLRNLVHEEIYKKS